MDGNPPEGDPGPAPVLRVLVVDNIDVADALVAVAGLLGCEARTCYGHFTTRAARVPFRGFIW